MIAYYLSWRFSAAHIVELLLLAAAWTLLENRPWESPRALGRALCELLGLLLTLFLLDIYVTSRAPLQYPLYWIVAQGAVSCVYVFMHPQDRCRAGLALWCSMYAGSISLAAIGGQLSIVLNTCGVSSAWQGAARNCLVAMSDLLALYLGGRRLDEYERVPLSGLFMILAGDLCLFLIRWLETRWFTVSYEHAVIFAACYFCVLMLVLLAVYAVDSICREQTRGMQLLAEKQRAESEHDLVRLTQKQLDDLRQLRHDIKNQYACMRILLAERRYDELETYFRHQDSELALLTAPLDCGNRCVSIVLNMERQKAASVGVSLHTKLVVPPVLPFPDDDMCSLLSNLIDNAVEECVRLGESLPQVREEGVSLSINPGNPSSDYLYIETKNPTDRKKLARRTDGLVTTKKDASLHGYGTRIITRIAEKYNGSTFFEAADGVFTARVLLDMMYNPPAVSLGTPTAER